MNPSRLSIVVLPLIVGLCFVGAAGLHRMGMGTAAYTRSPLIGVEFILGVLLGVQILLQPISLAYLAWRREWVALGAVVVATMMAIGLLLAGFALDAPTLLYAT